MKTRIGSIGAGVIGASVAEDLARHDFRPVVVDVSDSVLDAARRRIRSSLRSARLLDPSTRGEPTASVLDRLEFTTDLTVLADVGMVIESATEDLGIKESLYRRLDDVCAPGCIFIANTSCIPIARLAGFTKRPEQVVGVHFMNPVPMKQTVELIPSPSTSHETLRRTKAFLGALGKRFVQVRDAPGFVSNRVLMLCVNEAAQIVEEGVADAAGVDEVFKSCFGHPMGPLETGDLIGLDTVVRSLRVLQQEFGDPKYQPCALLESMVSQGRLGRKTGKGFHPYS